MKAAKGHVFKYGDHVDTDVIIPARYLNSFDPKELAVHCMEDIDTGFADNVKAAVLEIRKIRGNRFSVGVDTASFQVCENIRYDCGMFLIGVIPQIFQYV